MRHPPPVFHDRRVGKQQTDGRLAEAEPIDEQGQDSPFEGGEQFGELRPHVRRADFRKDAHPVVRRLVVAVLNPAIVPAQKAGGAVF